jgi:uncharacterized protein DUF6603
MNAEDIQNYLDIVAKFIDPVVRAFESKESATALLNELGYAPPGEITAFENIGGIIDVLYDLIESVNEIVDNDGNVQEILPELLELFYRLGMFLSELDDLQAKIDDNFSGSDFLAETDVLAEISRKVIDYLFCTFFETNYNTTYSILIILGLIDEIYVDEMPTIFHVAYKRKVINWEKIEEFFNDPIDTLLGNLKNTDNIFFEKLIFLLNDLGSNIGVFSDLIPPDINALDAFNNGQDLSTIDKFEDLLMLHFPLVGDPEAELSLDVYPIINKVTEEYTGLGTGINFGSELEIKIGNKFKLVTTFSTSLNNSLGFTIDSNGDFKFINNVFVSPEQLADNIQLGAKVELVGEGENDDEKLFVVGSPDGSRFEIGKWELALGIEKTDDINVFVETNLSDGKLLIDLSGADGFISNVAGSDIEANFSLGVGFSNRAGLYFKGNSGLEIKLPTHIELGPIEIQSLLISLLFKDDSIPLNIGATFALNLGPLKAVVEDIGIKFDSRIKGDRSGNFGPLDIDLGFKPPNGIGLSIDASVIKGGGFLRFDPDKEEYDGMLELDLNGIVSIKAIALITTKMPDGSKGFSLLIILTAEFGSPIQLGLGFTLSGVGGLLGLNRTMRLEKIASGIRDGGINSVMFPQNIVANAPRIISDLKNYFPVEEGTFLIGPMVKIGWGTPNLVTVSLGVIIEIPGNIAILGVLKVALPDEDNALIVIQVNFMGAIEFDKQRLWFFASIFDSRVLFITLEGEMGLLVGWGDDSNFVVSVGGFHPAFNPPALPFGSIARIAISILNTDYARIRVEAYFAVTSNSVQFGAAVELYFGMDAFKIEGGLAFDALFRFSPFYFVITISASLSVKVFGVGLFSVSMRGSLEGPTPWTVEGTGSISILFFSIDVDFSHTWGEASQTTLPPITVMPLLEAEYQKLENWQAILPDSNQLLVSLRSFEQDVKELVLHPVGSLKISQRSIPLGLTIDKVGNQKPVDANNFNVTVSTVGIDEKGRINESFAVGQFFTKSDSELLNAKSFEPMKGGVELSVAGEQYSAPKAVKRVVRYEEIIIDTFYKRHVKKFYVWIGALFNLFLDGNAVSQSVLSSKQKKKLQPFDVGVQVNDALFTVAFNNDNTVFNEQAMGFTSQVEAQQFMKQKVDNDAGLSKQLHVIPQSEMRRAA